MRYVFLLLGFICAPATASFAEVDPEKFVPVSLQCQTSENAMVLTKANAAGRSVRFVRKDGTLYLMASNSETNWRFKIHAQSKIAEIDQVADQEHQKWLRNALSQMDTLNDRVCNDKAMVVRYEAILEQFRRKIGITSLPE